MDEQGEGVGGDVGPEADFEGEGVGGAGGAAVGEGVARDEVEGEGEGGQGGEGGGGEVCEEWEHFC